VTDKRQVKKNIKRLQRIKTWQLVIILLLAGLISLSFLRLNNIGMEQRRQAILNADDAGDIGSVSNSLYALKRYSAGHMNAATGAIYLQGSYKRDVEKIVQASKDASVANREANIKADQVCSAQFPGYSQAYVLCNRSEQAKYQGSSALDTTTTFPNPNLYRFSFYSPAWSPDFAGWSLVVCVVLTLVIITRLISLGILRLLLRRHYSII